VAEPAGKSAEALARDAMIAPQVRRHAWINIVGPLCAIALGAAAAMIYLRPAQTLRWIQIARIGWGGVAENEIAAGDDVIKYLITGGYSGMEPVVLVHGLGPSAALVWRGVMSPINAAHFVVVAPNLPGFDGSDHKQVKYTIAYQAAALGKFIDALKLDHVNLVGDNLGADVVLYYAVDHPEKVERLILVSGGLVGAKGAASMRAMIPVDAASMRAQVEASYFGIPPMPDAIYERMVAQMAGDLQAQTDMLNSVPHDEGYIRAKLGKIFNTLAIIIWGGRSPYFSKAQGEAIHDALPGSATVVFKTSGEYPQLEHPDDFADSLVFILKQTEGGQ
jgi:pimeloyl-ACP methyl ester carboxylesterase